MVTSLLSGGTVGSVFSLNQAVPILILGVMTTAFMAILNRSNWNKNWL